MFSHFSPSRKSITENALFFVWCVAVSVAVAGCTDAVGDPDYFDRQFVPVGCWTDGYGGYTITNGSVEYDSGFGQTFTATIEAAADFSGSSGVLIVKVTVASADDPGNFIDNYTVGKYTAVFYKGYTSSHLFLANPIDLSGSYAAIEKDDFNAALTAFTADTVGDYVDWSQQSGYDK